MKPGGARLSAMLLAALLAAGCGDGGAGSEIRASRSPVTLLAREDVEGYLRADGPRTFQFPEDLGPHPGFRTEWWYLTGHLTSEDGRRFAFQVTFFRNAVAPEVPGRRSGWNTNQLWLAHLALTDVEGRRHLQAERMGREAVGIAGAASGPLRVWLDEWSLAGSSSGDGTGHGDAFPLQVRAREDRWGVELRVEEGKPPVLQGEQGWSRKGPEPGNASYYFSFTRLPISGVVVLDGERIPVEGQGWMDREWSTSALGPEHVGWDWFSLQLSDGRELTFFELRRRDGRPDSLAHGSLVEADGTVRRLSSGDWELEATGRWQSPLDGTSYPSGWTVRMRDVPLELEIQPLLRDQEMALSFRYWEGAVEVTGTGSRGPLHGLGFVELTGYGSGSVSGR